MLMNRCTSINLIPTWEDLTRITSFNSVVRKPGGLVWTLSRVWENAWVHKSRCTRQMWRGRREKQWNGKHLLTKLAPICLVMGAMSHAEKWRKGEVGAQWGHRTLNVSETYSCWTHLFSFPSLHQSLEQSSTMNYQVSLWAHFSTMAPNRASKLENLGLPGTHPVQYPDDGWHQGSRPNQTLQGVEEGKLLSE